MKYSLAEKYLPHGVPMVMVQNVHLVDNEHCICSVQVSRDGILAPFLNSQYALPNFYCIELMAQTIGVWSGYHGIQSQRPPQLGMLLGGRALKTTVTQFPEHSQLIIKASLVLADAKLANFDCQIMLGEQCVASGKLNVYEPDQAELTKLLSLSRSKD